MTKSQEKLEEKEVKKKFLRIGLLTAVIIVAQLGFIGFVRAPPLPIGSPGYVQSNPYESNPTSSASNGIVGTSGLPEYTYDGDLSDFYAFQYGASPSGYFNLSSFKNTPSSLFSIGWVDFKICYAAEASTNDRYRIVYRVGSASPVVLQSWVGGANASFGDLSAPPIRAWSNQTEPNDGVWDWTDINSVQVSFETNGVGANDLKGIFLFEVWLTVYAVPPSPTPILPSGVSVQPAGILNVTGGNVFYVDIYAANVSRMLGYQFKLGFDPNVLVALEFFSYYPFTSLVFTDIGTDYVFAAYLSSIGGAEGFTGNGPLGRVYFVGIQDGATGLHLFPSPVTRFVDTMGNPFDLPLADGVFSTVPYHDIQVANVETNATIVWPGKSLTVNVTVVNSGTFYETFDVAVMYDSTPIEIRPIPFLGPGLGTTMYVVPLWNTSGVPLGFHEIKANVTVVSGDVNPVNNEFVNGIVLVGRHDIAVTNVVRISPSDVTVPEDTTLNVTRGEIIHVNVTLENKGTFLETSINVTTQWNVSPPVHIGSVTIITLDVGASTTLTFSYNTSAGWDFPVGVNHINGKIQANISAVPYEQGADYDFVFNNRKIDGILNVTRPVSPQIPTAQFTVTPTTAFVGQPVKFDASASTTPSGTTIISYKWDFADGNVTTVTEPIIYHKYSSSGTYAAILTVTNNASFSDTTAPSPDRTVTVSKRNIKVVSAVPSSTSVIVGQTLNINVTVINQGDKTEDFDVTAYYDNTVIDTSRITGLAAGASRSVVISWNTTGASPHTYPVKASLEILTWETNTTDNSLSGGTVSVSWHNIAIASVTPDPIAVLVGRTVSITVVVVNQGNFTETFTVTAKHGTVDIGTQAVTSLAAGSYRTLNFTWDTTGMSIGRYTIDVVASTVAGETETDDNTLSSGMVSVWWHNIAVTSVIAAPNEIDLGDEVEITVVVVNQGNFTETFTVSVKYGTTEIETQTVSALSTGSTRTLTFTWDTADVVAGTYVINAIAGTVTGETKITDNSLTGNSVTVNAEAPPSGPDISMYVIVGVVAIIVLAAALLYYLRMRKS